MSSPVAATLPVSSVAPVAAPATELKPSSQTAGTLEGLDRWLKDFQKYETILAEMAEASADNKFRDELATIEQWFKVLSEPERTASVYTLLQHSTQDQIRFFMAVLQRMIKSEERTSATDVDSKPKLRPPSLNIPLPGSPTTPIPLTSRAQDSATIPLVDNSSRLNLPKTLGQTPSSPGTHESILRTPALDKSWASMVNTPLVPMFHKSEVNRSEVGSGVNGTGLLQSGNTGGSKGPGLAAINPATLNLLACSGLSNEAQLLAVQLVMSGILQPADISTSQNQPPPSSTTKSHKKASHSNWRTPSSAKYPGSALRTGGPKTSGLKSSGLKSSGLKSAGLLSSGLDSASMESPRVEDFNPELLKDIPAWLRSLRLHKYTGCFEGMTWEEMVVLDDAILEEKGVAALGARRRLLRTFDHVRKEMGMEDANSATPTTSLVTSDISLNPDGGSSGEMPVAPQSALPTTKLSADSPVFMPGKVPHSAVPVVAAPSIVTSAV